MSENQHKCKLIGVELQREFLEVMKFNWKDSYKNPDEIMVDISKGELPPFYVSFSEFVKYSNIYWNILKDYPIDITQFDDGVDKTFDVVLYSNDSEVSAIWVTLPSTLLEETLLQVVVTVYNISKTQEE